MSYTVTLGCGCCVRVLCDPRTGHSRTRTIEARSTGGIAADRFEAFYQARPDAGSGWIGFDLTREFAPYTFQFDTPPRGAVMSYDYFALRPVAPDKQRTMEVKSVRFRTVSARRPDAT